jgi:uncharacterized protein YjiS (DUF1127 family)
VKQVSKRLDYNQIAPEGLEALGGVHGYIAQSSLPATLVDLVYLRVSQITNCAYCLDTHTFSQRATWPPSAAVRQRSIADIIFRTRLAEGASISIRRSRTMSSSTIKSHMSQVAGLNGYSWPAALVWPITRGIAWIGAQRLRRRAIAELMALDDRTLRDIGLSRSEIAHVVRRGRPSDRVLP